MRPQSSHNRGPPSKAKSQPMMIAAAVRGLYLHLKLGQTDWRQLLSRAGLTPEMLEDGETLIPLDQGFNAFDLAARWSGDPALGINYAASVEVGHISPIGFALVNARTVRAALETIARFLPMIASLYKGDYVEDDEAGSVVWRYPGVPAPHSLQFMIWGAALALNRLQPALPVGWKPFALDLDIPRPRNADAMEAHFGPGLRFGREINRFAVELEYLERPMPEANPRIFELMTRLAELEQQHRGVHSSVFETNLREAIVHGLSEGRTTIAGVAHDMEMPVARLRRELKDHSLDFRRLLDSIRKQKARDYLLASELSITEIAFQLGYSDSSVFTRACRDWFGSTPRDYRARKSPGKPA